ncbi:MAG: hypothetical protein V3T30_07975 [Thermodesulfobacteriota bacterium]
MEGAWRNISISAALSWLMKFVMVLLFFYHIAIADYLFVVACAIALVVSFAPSVIQRSYHVTLPFEIDLLVTLAIFLHIYLGEELMFYERIGFWDAILHFFNTSVISLLGFMIVYTLHYTHKLRFTIPMFGFFTVIFALSMGVIWEILEFLVDSIFHTTAQKGLADTMWDLIFDLIAGIVVAIFGMLYARYSVPEERKRMTKPIGEVLGLSDRIDRFKGKFKGNRRGGL